MPRSVMSFAARRRSKHAESSDQPAPPARLARSASTRPTRRAVVGGLLVAAAALVTLLAVRTNDRRPGHSIVIATRTIAPGERLDAASLEVRTIDIDDDLAQHDFSSTAQLVDGVALAPIGVGEAVQRSAVLQDSSGERLRQFSFPVDRERALNGDLRAGERVDILATFGTGSDATTTVLSRDALILRSVEQKSGTLSSSGSLILTVGLPSADQVLDAVHAAQVADLTVVRATLADPASSSRQSTTGPSTRTAGGRP